MPSEDEVGRLNTPGKKITLYFCRMKCGDLHGAEDIYKSTIKKIAKEADRHGDVQFTDWNCKKGLAEIWQTRAEAANAT